MFKVNFLLQKFVPLFKSSYPFPRSLFFPLHLLPHLVYLGYLQQVDVSYTLYIGYVGLDVLAHLAHLRLSEI